MITIASLRGGKLATLLLVTVLLLLQGRGYYAAHTGASTQQRNRLAAGHATPQLDNTLTQASGLLHTDEHLGSSSIAWSTTGSSQSNQRLLLQAGDEAPVVVMPRRRAPPPPPHPPSLPANSPLSSPSSPSPPSPAVAIVMQPPPPVGPTTDLQHSQPSNTLSPMGTVPPAAPSEIRSSLPDTSAPNDPSTETYTANTPTAGSSSSSSNLPVRAGNGLFGPVEGGEDGVSVDEGRAVAAIPPAPPRRIRPPPLPPSPTTRPSTSTGSNPPPTPLPPPPPPYEYDYDYVQPPSPPRAPKVIRKRRPKPPAVNGDFDRTPSSTLAPVVAGSVVLVFNLALNAAQTFNVNYQQVLVERIALLTPATADAMTVLPDVGSSATLYSSGGIRRLASSKKQAQQRRRLVSSTTPNVSPVLVISITPQRAASWQTTATALADKLQALLSQGNFVDFFLSYDIILRSFTVLVSERADLTINPDAFPVNSATPVQAGFQAPHAPGSHAHAAKGSDGSLNNTLDDNLPILIGAAVAGAILMGALTALLVMYVQKRRRGFTRKHQLLIKSQRSSSGVDFCNLDSSPSTARTALLPSPFGTSPEKGTSASVWLAHAYGHGESCCAMCVRSGRSGKAALFSALAGGKSLSLAHGPYRKLARSHSSPSLELRLVQSSSGSSSRCLDGNQSTSSEPDLYPPSSHHSSQNAVSACSQGSKRTSGGSHCSLSNGSCSGSTATVKRDGRTSKNRVAAALDEAASSPSGICTVSSSSISDINTRRDAGGGGGQAGSCTLHPLPQGSRLEIWAHAISDGDQASSTPSCSGSRDVVIPMPSAVALTRVLSYDRNEVANASVSSHQDPRMPQHRGEGAFVGSSSNSELTPAVSRWPMHMHSVFADAPSCLLQSGSIRVDAHTDSDTASGWGTPTLHGACSAAAPGGFLPGPALSLDRASSLLNQRRASTSRLAFKGTSAAGAAAGADGTEDAGSAQAAADVGISKQSLLYAASTSGHAAMTSATAMLGSAFQHEQAMSLDLLKWSSGIPSQLPASVWGTSSEIAGAMIQHALMDSSGIAAGNTGSGPNSTRASLSTVATAAVVSDVCGPFQQGQRLVAANTVGDAVCVGDMSMAGKEMQAGGDARLGRSCLSVPAEGLTTALASQQKG